MNSQVCIDVNLVLKLVLVEEDSPKAQHLWDTWVDADIRIVAPPLLAFEGTSVICNKMQRGLVPPEEAGLMFKAFHLLDVRLLYPDGLHETAWEMAKRFNRPQAYDSHYLALAEILGLELWTADKRLYNAVKHDLSWVKWLGDYSPV
ncbi:MAG: type II toxin-antitoxin system VapC family toxin [Anaerolineae bacterium]|nr:type II toxin-antitoxin system VapC family toxin [Anaerolineae bacterium]MCK4452584.1 type II toxin-antitoxin system VapC family toxin [Anaerolineae bacterium]MCK4472998.1 type II toxin-antitoxin system VapC family toxin [Anaerolineae bacterium]